MDQLLATIRAAADPTRLRLLAILARAELTVTELTHVLGQSQPRVSRHLKLMVQAGLLNRFQEGSWVFYRLTEKGHGAALGRFLTDRMPGSDPTVVRDLERLDAVRRQRSESASAYFRAQAGKWNEIRALHIAEDAVETAMLDLLGPEPLGDVLDIGTGTGQVLTALAPRARSAVGIDQSREMLAIARTALDRPDMRHVQVRQGDLFALPQAPGSVDLVTIHLVLHYLDDPAAAILEAARTLRPGGRLLIADFAPHDLEFLRDEHAHRRLGFTHDEIGAACTAAGLTLRASRALTPKSATGGELTVVLWLAEQTSAVAYGAASASSSAPQSPARE